MNAISATSPGLSGARQAQLQSRPAERQPPAPPPVQQPAQIKSSAGKGLGQSIDIRA